MTLDQIIDRQFDSLSNKATDTPDSNKKVSHTDSKKTRSLLEVEGYTHAQKKEPHTGEEKNSLQKEFSEFLDSKITSQPAGKEEHAASPTPPATSQLTAAPKVADDSCPPPPSKKRAGVDVNDIEFFEITNYENFSEHGAKFKQELVSILSKQKEE
ncbi:MAG: hypothetical protein GY757_04100 [bacterium]|nr:hypothetical protein [bacterium]